MHDPSERTFEYVLSGKSFHNRSWPSSDSGWPVPALFSFGDSSSDVGNNNYLLDPPALSRANFIPYGRAFFNPQNPTGRASDGRILIDFIAEHLGLPYLRPFLEPGFADYSKGVGFASAGSGFMPGTLTSIDAIWNGSYQVINMPEQLDQFRLVKASLIANNGTAITEHVLGNAIYYISSGTNDVVFDYDSNATVRELYTIDQYLDLLIEAVEDTVKALYEEGGRKIVVSGMTPYGCSPSQAATMPGFACNDTTSEFGKLFGSKFPAMRHRLQISCPFATVVNTNPYDIFEDVIKNGSAYGYTKQSLACCGIGTLNSDAAGCGIIDESGNPLYNLCTQGEVREYVFWDFAHPTESVNQLLGELFFSGDGRWSAPMNVEALAHL
ncbi:hypothetical protein Mapa_008600 [Marchantia paleacea]|nr:hypothetical protein Mapa_008600 [Marchantia paleacea]